MVLQFHHFPSCIDGLKSADCDASLPKEKKSMFVLIFLSFNLLAIQVIEESL